MRPTPPRTPSAPEPIVFERTFEVGEADIDGLGHVNNVVYLRWIQAVAAEHWRSAADPRRIGDTVWVVLRHEIDYERPALEGDTVLVRTWVGDSTATRWDRHTEVRRSATGELLARARSVWCPLAAGSGRPKRVSDEIRAPFYRKPC